MNNTSWNRKLWGVEFTGSDNHRMLLGTAWHGYDAMFYPGEPKRALLFCTRSQARAWCKAEMSKYAGRTDCCGAWRFRPVRVTETVR